ncbi:MAG: hypothetical protein WBK77_03320 [Alphaproteobacteria bacterium]
MTTKNIFRQRLLGFLSFALTATFPVALFAEQSWTIYYSHNGSFNLRLPANTTTKIHQLLIADNTAVRLEEVSGVVDFRPYKNITNSYLVKLDYTIGPAVSQEEAEALINKEFKNLADYYIAQGGVIQRQENRKYYSYPGGEILFLFNTKDKGIQGTLIRIVYTESLRFHLVVNGNESAMSSYATNDFLDSFNFSDGIPMVEDTFKKTWKKLESPSGIFSVSYPVRKAPPYYSNEPVSTWDDKQKTESVKTFFYDPVRGEKIFFNVYGYQLGANMTFDGARDILIKKHIMNYRKSASDIKFTKGVGNESGATGTRDFPFISATLRIKQPAGYPYLHYMKLNAFFAENKLIVLETLASSKMLDSHLEENFNNQIAFHPKKNHAFKKPDISSLPPELPVKEGPDATSIPVAERMERERIRAAQEKGGAVQNPTDDTDDSQQTPQNADAPPPKPAQKEKDPNEIEVIVDSPAKPATP